MSDPDAIQGMHMSDEVAGLLDTHSETTAESEDDLVATDAGDSKSHLPSLWPLKDMPQGTHDANNINVPEVPENRANLRALHMYHVDNVEIKDSRNFIW